MTLSTTLGRSATGAPFSFHCLICIEPFNGNDRPPVVLPCGHTYICEPCSRRIDKCTECRMSLFVQPDDLTSSHPGSGYGCGNGYGCTSYDSEQSDMDQVQTVDYLYPLSPVASSASSSIATVSSPLSSSPLSRKELRQIRLLDQRYGSATRRKAARRPRPQRVRVALPRNLVLLELMDAAEKQHQYSTTRQQTPFLEEKGASIILMEDGSSIGALVRGHDEDNDQEVLGSIEVLASSCGTYLVKEKNGLPVHPVSTITDLHIVGTSSSDDLITVSSSGSNNIMSGLRKKRWTRRKRRSQSAYAVSKVLKRGQKVQITNVQDGIYRLARNQGIIFADSTQLVKIGIAQESSCKVEGMIHLMHSTKAKLVQQTNSVDYVVNNLSTHLNHLFLQPEDYPVISETSLGYEIDVSKQNNQYSADRRLPEADKVMAKHSARRSQLRLMTKKNLPQKFSSLRSRSSSSSIGGSSYNAKVSHVPVAYE